MDPQRLLRFLRLIEEIPLEYMVTGSIAAILYGKPRLTHDMDVVLIFPRQKIKNFCQRFSSREFYCPPAEAIQEELKRGDQGHMNIIDNVSGFKMDLYPFREDPLVQWGFENRKKVEILPGESAWLAPPEYVILKKLIYYKEGGSDKHLEDIRAMTEVSGPMMAQTLIRKWVTTLKLEDVWERI